MIRRCQKLSSLLALLATLTTAPIGAKGESAGWHAVPGPSAGPSRVIGSYANGCIAGAVALPSEGPGYQVIRLSRKRNFGHPTLIAYIQDLGRRVQRGGIGSLVVGDLSQPRGGPMNYGHASHQSGLDVDIWFRLDLPRLPVAERETLEQVYLADPGAMRLHKDRWTRDHGELVRLAAIDERVVRIFVNPAIKRALCDDLWQDRRWLRKVRPWWGHAAHLHIRLRCPQGSADCKPQNPPPPGEGCGSALDAWFRPPDPQPAKPARPRAKPPLPTACMRVLTAG